MAPGHVDDAVVVEPSSDEERMANTAHKPATAISNCARVS